MMDSCFPENVVAAFLCTHTEEELDRMVVPELADMITACSEPITVSLTSHFPNDLVFLLC